MHIEFTSDELILALVSLIRATNPAMLRPGPDGFSVDFESLEGKQELSAEEELLLKFRTAMDSPGASAHSLELAPSEARRLAASLERVESLQPWSPDVIQMIRNLCTRLAAIV